MMTRISMTRGAGRLAAAVLPLLWVAGALAGPALYPVRQLVGYNAAVDRALLDPMFVQAVEKRGQNWFVQFYVDDFRKQFGKTATATIDASNRLKTFAASLQLTRASHYTVPGLDGTVTHFYPVTLGLTITNPLTGEIVHTVSRTRYQVLKVRADEDEAEVGARSVALYQDNMEQLIHALVGDAVAGFRPVEISAALTREWNGLYLLDKGLDAGLAPGDDVQDEAGNLLKLVYAGNGYAVAAPVLANNIKPRARFARYSTMTASQLRKPRLLVLPSAGNSPEDELLAGLFGQLLPPGTAFSLTPVNRDHQQVLDALARDTDIGQAAVRQNRALPEFFIRLQSAPPLMYELPTQSPSVVHRLYEGLAFGEVLDSAGRVVFATTARQRIDDEIVNGSGFDPAARYEILMKNLVQELADRFASRVQFRTVSARVQQVNDRVVLADDAAAALDLGTSVRIYRTLETPAGREAVQVPLWDAQVTGRRGTQAELTLVLPLSNALQKVLPVAGDTVQARASGAAVASGAVRLQPCTTDRTQYGWALPGFDELAWYTLAEQGTYPLYEDWRETRASLDILTRYAGFRAPLQTTQMETDWCVQPASRIDVGQSQCRDGLCSVRVSANIALGVRGRNDSKPRYFGQKIEPVINKVPQGWQDEVVASQLQQAIMPLLQESVRRINQDAWSQGGSR